MMRTWAFNPKAKGKKIPQQLKAVIQARVCKHAESTCAGQYERLQLRFRGDLCYIDAYREPDEPDPGLLNITGESAEHYRERLANCPIHLCRVRYYGDMESWGLAFYKYSSESYELCVFPSGQFRGTLEEAFDVGSIYLQG